MKALFLFSLISFLSVSSYASTEKNEGRYLDYAKGQFAGEIGFLSVGVGKKFSDWYQLTGMYGYVPPAIDVDDIHTIAFKNDFTFYRPHQDISIYFDATILIVLGEKYWPALYNKNMTPFYYYNSGVEGILSFGTSYELPKKWGAEHFSIYTEYGVLAQWLYFYVDNYGVVPFFDITTLTFGVNYKF
ncbi:MAG: hypothetical protein KAG61_10715 [Bacteriovoracaceae bacterium]|nr:hypothetical protein [Bacteriovoracaceae bacterium]